MRQLLWRALIADITLFTWRVFTWSTMYACWLYSASVCMYIYQNEHFTAVLQVQSLVPRVVVLIPVLIMDAVCCRCYCAVHLYPSGLDSCPPYLGDRYSTYCYNGYVIYIISKIRGPSWYVTSSCSYCTSGSMWQVGLVCWWDWFS